MTIFVVKMTFVYRAVVPLIFKMLGEEKKSIINANPKNTQGRFSTP